MNSRFSAAGSLLILLIAWLVLTIWFLFRPFAPRNPDRLVQAFDGAFLEVQRG